MKLLFLMRHAGYVRNFESTLRMLSARGHQVHLAFQGRVKYEALDPGDIARQLASECPGFTYGDAPMRGDGWGALGRELRLGLDYLRYLSSAYAEAPKLRERATREAPPEVLARATAGALANPLGRRFIAATLRAKNRAIPVDRTIETYLRQLAPDVIAVTPLIEPGSPQAEYLRAARTLGIRTAYCVASWDNLTNKGLIHGPVDLVTVWNHAMKQEAVSMHGVPASRVVVTGAAAFDHWFEWRASTTPEDFRRRVGLPSGRPFLLYLCSSKFVAPNEVSFVRSWVHRLRQAPAPIRDVGVLIRPHPQNAEQWEGFEADGSGPVAVFPRAGAAPVDAQSRNDYFDSMFHSAAVVGINTTAEIESAILGRRVFTVLAGEFRDTQSGTLHFHHLRRVNGGLLNVAANLDQHVEQLQTQLGGDVSDATEARRFVEGFVRPHGLDVPATPRMVEALERLAAAPAPVPAGEPVWAEWVRSRMRGRVSELENDAEAARIRSRERQAAKTAREERRRARDAERAAQLAERVKAEQERRSQPAKVEPAERHTLESLIVDFASLDESRRRIFLRGVVDSIPADSFIDLHASMPPRRLDYDKADIYLRVATKGETFRLRGCAKEPFTVQWLHTHVGADEVLYDIGANIGVYSLVAARKPNPARVFSFEASYASVASLCANIVLNDVADRITPMPVALSNRTGMNLFSLRDLEPGAARHALGGGEPEDGPALFRQPVMMFSLDDLIGQFSLPLPNHIKLDVDGGELEVLDGAARTLSSPELRSVMVEVSSDLSEPVAAVLTRHGLQLESKVAVKNKAGEYAVWYGLFGRGARSVDTEAAAARGGVISQ